MRRKYRTWTQKEDDLIRKFHAEGKTDTDIGYIIDRRRSVVKVHRERLGLPNLAKLGPKPGWHHNPGACAAVAAENRRRWREDPKFRARAMENLRKGRERQRVTCFRRPTSREDLSLFRRLCHAFDAKVAREHLRAGTMAEAVARLEKERKARLFKMPPKGTPQRNQYLKLRRALGPTAARAELPRILDASP